MKLPEVPGAGWTQIFLFLGLVEKGLYTFDPTRQPGAPRFLVIRFLLVFFYDFL